MPRLRYLAAAPLFVLALTGCDTINQASDTLDKAEVCTKALSAAGYTPDLSNPEGSVEDAQKRAQELRDLADQTADATLQQELEKMADEIGSLQVSDVNPTAAATWASEKLAQIEKLRQACG